jgi:hypothetical protein
VETLVVEGWYSEGAAGSTLVSQPLLSNIRFEKFTPDACKRTKSLVKVVLACCRHSPAVQAMAPWPASGAVSDTALNVVVESYSIYITARVLSSWILRTNIHDNSTTETCRPYEFKNHNSSNNSVLRTTTRETTRKKMN